MEYHAAVKENEIIPSAATWMQLEITTHHSPPGRSSVPSLPCFNLLAHLWIMGPSQGWNIQCITLIPFTNDEVS